MIFQEITINYINFTFCYDKEFNLACILDDWLAIKTDIFMEFERNIQSDEIYNFIDDLLKWINPPNNKYIWLDERLDNFLEYYNLLIK